MKKYFAITLIGILALVPVAKANSDNENDMSAGLIYGEGHAFLVSAPDGWILDNSSGVEQGLYAVFYPKGSSWKKSNRVMYVNTVKKDAGKQIKDFIKDDIDQIKNNGGAKVKVAIGKEIVTKDRKKAQIRTFTGDKYNNYEAIAYITEKEIFVIIALSTKSANDYKHSVEAFNELVKSYSFITDNVIY